MTGSAASLMIPSSSAPSPKTFTRRSVCDGNAFPSFPTGSDASQDPVDRFRQLFDDEGGALRLAFLVAAVDEDCRAPGVAAGLDVFPSVAHHDASGQVQAEISRRVQQHARRGLATGAAVDIIVRADIDRVQQERGLEQSVQAIYRLTTEGPAGDVRLVGDHHHRHPCLAKPPAGGGRSPLQVELGLIPRRVRPAADQDRLAQHAVAVEEHSRSRLRQSMDSHLVPWRWSAGCETRRCQTTAHNPSVCGVTRSWKSGGIRTEAFALWRVNPPSRPTMPKTAAPTSSASSMAATRLAETPLSRSPPPTEKTRSASSRDNREPRSHSLNVVSQPSSFTRAV